MSTVLPAPDPVLGGRNPCLSGPLSQRPAHVGYLVGRLSKMYLICTGKIARYEVKNRLLSVLKCDAIDQ